MGLTYLHGDISMQYCTNGKVTGTVVESLTCSLGE